MAYKAKSAHYFFKMDSPTFISIAKFTPDGEFQQSYSLERITAHGVEDWVCDCPAAHRYSDREDKHVQWWKRLQAIIRDQPDLLRENVVYYDSQTDSFYQGQSLDSTLLLEPTHEGPS